MTIPIETWAQLKERQKKERHALIQIGQSLPKSIYEKQRAERKEALLHAVKCLQSIAEIGKKLELSEITIKQYLTLYKITKIPEYKKFREFRHEKKWGTHYRIRNERTQEAILAAHGNIAEAAKLLGISRQCLHAYLKKHKKIQCIKGKRIRRRESFDVISTADK